MDKIAIKYQEKLREHQIRVAYALPSSRRIEKNVLSDCISQFKYAFHNIERRPDLLTDRLIRKNFRRSFNRLLPLSYAVVESCYFYSLYVKINNGILMIKLYKSNPIELEFNFKNR